MLVWDGSRVQRRRVEPGRVVPAPTAYASLGGLIVRKAGNLTGWILLGLAVALSVMSLASAWAVLA